MFEKLQGVHMSAKVHLLCGHDFNSVKKIVYVPLLLMSLLLWMLIIAVSFCVLGILSVQRKGTETVSLIH